MTLFVCRYFQIRVGAPLHMHDNQLGWVAHGINKILQINDFCARSSHYSNKTINNPCIGISKVKTENYPSLINSFFPISAISAFDRVSLFNPFTAWFNSAAVISARPILGTLTIMCEKNRNACFTMPISGSVIIPDLVTSTCILPSDNCARSRICFSTWP